MVKELSEMAESVSTMRHRVLVIPFDTSIVQDLASTPLECSSVGLPGDLLCEYPRAGSRR